ncbi:MAG TPA: pyridoxamine 5'-phosphate oxidase family protein [Stellaceae bacterium]|nr:pyridoxamine 5'-phosphate oxidase family protein [Stellaceae bacterium]
MMGRAFAKLAFTDSVREAQRHNGTRAVGERIESHPAANDRLTQPLIDFIGERDSFFMATSSRAGWPYVQHRGGPAGFLHVLDPQTLAFADFSGNRQYLSVGNLAENDRVHLFLMDWVHARRLKIWGRAEVVEDPALIAAMMPEGYDAKPERVIRIHIEAWDMNCNQHITQRVSQRELAPYLAAQQQRIAALEAKLKEAGLPLP